MLDRAVPMLHVPDVAATVRWYEAVGFALEGQHHDCGEMLWAMLRCGESTLMLNAGGRPSDAERREVDVYVHVSDLDAAFARVAPLAEVVEAVHETEYGMREFIVRDPNRFWMTFGQPMDASTGTRAAGRVRIALAALPVPADPADAVARAVDAVAEAGRRGAAIVCFPECYVPGYRWPGMPIPAADAVYLERAWRAVADAARDAQVAVILGTERITDRGLMISACVIDATGTIVGWQDKGQLDPGEEATYPAFGAGRRVFTVGGLTVGVVICHEGWRYPETVRWAARRGAQVVFHPHFGLAEPGSHRPTTFGEPANTFHEQAVRCRAAENTIFVASVNCASDGAPTTSVVVRPDGSVLAWQPYGEPGLLVADLDLAVATGLLAARCRTSPL